MVGRVNYPILFCGYLLDATKYEVKEVLAILLLCIPTVWELCDDHKGDSNHAFDVFVRCGLVVLVSIFPWYIGHGYIASIFMAGGIFTISFDYLENAINLRRKDWFSYLGTTSVMDKIKPWLEMSPWYRFYLRLTIFTGSLVWYIFG